MIHQGTAVISGNRSLIQNQELLQAQTLYVPPGFPLGLVISSKVQSRTSACHETQGLKGVETRCVVTRKPTSNVDPKIKFASSLSELKENSLESGKELIEP